MIISLTAVANLRDKADNKSVEHAGAGDLVSRHRFHWKGGLVAISHSPIQPGTATQKYVSEKLTFKKSMNPCHNYCSVFLPLYGKHGRILFGQFWFPWDLGLPMQTTQSRHLSPKAANRIRLFQANLIRLL